MSSYPYILIGTVVVLFIIGLAVAWMRSRKIPPAYESSWDISSMTRSNSTTPAPRYARDLNGHIDLGGNGRRSRADRLGRRRRMLVRCHGAPCGAMLHRGSRHAK